MELWLLLFLGGLTYIIVRSSVARLTRTPVWLLWLTIMSPAFILVAWELLNEEETPIPTPILLLVVALSSLVYFWLVQRGRPKGNDAKESAPQGAQPTPPPQPTQPVRLLNAEEEAKLKGCFPWQVYYLQTLDYSPQAVLCRGKLRTVPEEAYRKIRNNIEQSFGDRFLVLFQEGLKDSPFFALVPNPRAKGKPANQGRVTRPGLALALLLCTLFSTTVIGADFAGVTPEDLGSLEDLALLQQGLPYALGLMGILGVHELSHYLAAVAYKIRATLPYFIPIPFFLGTFGAFIQMRSPIPHRRALFDVSLAGPLGGLVVTIPVLLWGIANSEIVALEEESGLLNIDSLDPRYSFLMTVLCKLALGEAFGSGVGLDLHPVAIAGYVGLIVTALNLMPVGQLDGGHIVHAMYGQRTAAGISQISRFLLLILAIGQPSFLLWAIILFFMPILDEPALNDVSELDNGRDAIGLLALALLVAIILPVPGAIANWINV